MQDIREVHPVFLSSRPLSSIPCVIYLGRKLTANYSHALFLSQGRTSQIPEAQSSQGPEEEAA